MHAYLLFGERLYYLVGQLVQTLVGPPLLLLPLRLQRPDLHLQLRPARRVRLQSTQTLTSVGLRYHAMGVNEVTAGQLHASNILSYKHPYVGSIDQVGRTDRDDTILHGNREKLSIK